METSTEDDLVNFFMCTTDAAARHRLLYRIINVLPSSDFKKCMSTISKCKKYRQRVAALTKKQNERKRTNTTIDEEQPNNKKLRDSRSAQHSLSVPLSLAKSGWLENYTNDQVVSIDVEKVEVPMKYPTKKKKFEMKAAFISVVNYDGKEIYKAK